MYVLVWHWCWCSNGRMVSCIIMCLSIKCIMLCLRPQQAAEALGHLIKKITPELTPELTPDLIHFIKWPIVLSGRPGGLVQHAQLHVRGQYHLRPWHSVRKTPSLPDGIQLNSFPAGPMGKHICFPMVALGRIWTWLMLASCYCPRHKETKE